MQLLTAGVLDMPSPTRAGSSAAEGSAKLAPPRRITVKMASFHRAILELNCLGMTYWFCGLIVSYTLMGLASFAVDCSLGAKTWFCSCESSSSVVLVNSCLPCSPSSALFLFVKARNLRAHSKPHGTKVNQIIYFNTGNDAKCSIESLWKDVITNLILLIESLKDFLVFLRIKTGSKQLFTF